MQKVPATFQSQPVRAPKQATQSELIYFADPSGAMQSSL